MNQYITGAAIRELRLQKNMTQLQLAELLSVSDKTVSKWETGKGYPDITLLEPIAETSSTPWAKPSSSATESSCARRNRNLQMSAI